MSDDDNRRPANWRPLLPPGGYVSGNDLVTLQVCNPTAGAISAANGYWKAVLQ